jgi:hypothetical protein
MDFVAILRSLEALLFEIVSWLLFYPATLWEALRRPIALSRRASEEFALPQDARYEHFLSPPLFLVLSLILGQLLEGLSIGSIDQGLSNLMTPVLGGKVNLLAVTAVVAAVWPTIAAAFIFWNTHEPLNRTRMRDLFYQQCVLIAPFVFFLSLSEIVSTYGRYIGVGALLLSALWYISVLTAWLDEASVTTRARSILCAILIFSLGLLVNYIFINMIT